ncbi:hypothetical protein, partial [Enterococcus casseliflavus]|uniref:hypothetical protein n=1 Tax=Enterococcus casseliflavus TaxID=37734 RepID=UPI003D152E45
SDVALTDVDNDADLDIVFVNRQSNVPEPGSNFFSYSRLLLNDGSGVFTEVTNNALDTQFQFNRRVIQPERWPMLGILGNFE